MELAEPAVHTKERPVCNRESRKRITRHYEHGRNDGRVVNTPRPLRLRSDAWPADTEAECSPTVATLGQTPICSAQVCATP